MMTLDTLREAWLAEFRRQQAYIDAAAVQLSDEQFRAVPAPGLNSVAVIVKHLAGNLRSRWTDWLNSDGEKPDRNRDDEFRDRGESREELIRRLREGFSLVESGIGALTPGDLGRMVKIRGEPHTVPLAVNRSLAHVAYHAGQVMLIARSLVGGESWKWQTVPPGQSSRFNEEMRSRFSKPG